MSKNFVNALKKEDNYTLTENGAVALKSTQSSLLDLFGQIGALRCRTDADIETAFIKAFAEDKLLATKMAFYARDIRFGGLGERRVFNVIMKFLAKSYPEIVKKNMKHISTFGRFDDLYEFVGTDVEDTMWDLIHAQWINDIENMGQGKPVSLMGKWLKSVNTSSKKSVALGKLTAKKLGLSEKAYRKTLSKLRNYINVVEVKMSSKSWEFIDYPHVPSRAMTIYRKAFKKHDMDGFNAYIEAVTNGTQKINASTLFPYDILERMCSYGFSLGSVKMDKVLEAQWKALPNYVSGENNVLVMADTSGSMVGRPMATSVGLAIYFAERNHGAFKDLFMTFSSKPSLVQLKGNSLYEKLKCVPQIVENTDLEKAFRLILDTAVNNNLAPEDMPKALVVISDMQFDSATCNRYGGKHWTFYDSMVKMFADKGYTIPNVIFWNVESRRDTFQITSDYKGVQLASGQSASTFKSILANIGLTPYEAMVNTINVPAYGCIEV